ncbi:MAG: hypothetical protein ACT443_06205, partial [Gemmatimonadota bacterium]
SARALFAFRVAVSALLLTAPVELVLALVDFEASTADIIVPDRLASLEQLERRQATRALVFGEPSPVLADSIRTTADALASYREIAAVGVVGYGAVMLLAAALGMFLLWRASGRSDVRALALFLGIYLSTELVGRWESGLDVAYAFMIGAIIATLLRFGALFPRQLTPEDLVPAGPLRAEGRARRALRSAAKPLRSLERLLLRPAVVWLSALAFGLLLAGLVQPRAIRRAAWLIIDLLPRRSIEAQYELLPLLLKLLTPLFMSAAIVVLLAIVTGVVIGLRYLWIGFHGADSAQRQRAAWVIQGIYLFFCMLLVTMVGWPLIGHRFVDVAQRPFIDPLVLHFGEIAGLTILLACIGFAVLHHDTFDTRLVLRRTTVYGALSVLILALFSGIEHLVSGVLADSLGAARSLGGWFAGAVVALTFGPLRKGLEQRTTRVFDRWIPVTALAHEGRRKRSVVVFSDLVGYTATSAHDPDAALTLAALFQKEARAGAERFGGRLVKKIGDAVLLDFDDAQNALAWCMDIAPRLETGCRLLDLPTTLLRTGVHAGDVVRGDGWRSLRPDRQPCRTPAKCGRPGRGVADPGCAGCGE